MKARRYTSMTTSAWITASCSEQNDISRTALPRGLDGFARLKHLRPAITFAPSIVLGLPPFESILFILTMLHQHPTTNSLSTAALIGGIVSGYRPRLGASRRRGDIHCTSDRFDLTYRLTVFRTSDCFDLTYRLTVFRTSVVRCCSTTQ